MLNSWPYALLAAYFQCFNNIIICSQIHTANRCYLWWYWILDAFYFCIEPPIFPLFFSFSVVDPLSSSSTRECQNALNGPYFLSLFNLPEFAASAEPGLSTPSTSFAFMPRPLQPRGESVTTCSPPYLRSSARCLRNQHHWSQTWSFWLLSSVKFHAPHVVLGMKKFVGNDSVSGSRCSCSILHLASKHQLPCSYWVLTHCKATGNSLDTKNGEDSDKFFKAPQNPFFFLRLIIQASKCSISLTMYKNKLTTGWSSAQRIRTFDI